MAGELVPELHDIGKLYDREALQVDLPVLRLRSHVFGDLAKVGFSEPQTASWVAARYHHGPAEKFPTGLRLAADPQRELPGWARQLTRHELADVFLLVAADHMACSISRALRNKLGDEELGGSDEWRRRFGTLDRSTTLKLWSHVAQVKAKLIRSGPEFQAMLDFLSRDPTREEFFATYGEALAITPEDKGFPRHVTTLATHSVLVGKFWRGIRHFCFLDPDERYLVYGIPSENEVARAETVDQIESWPFRLMSCKVIFPQRPARIHDLGILVELSDLLCKLAEKDHVLLHTLDTLWLFLPDEKLFPLRSALRPLFEAGFSVEAGVARQTLAMLSSDIFQKQPEAIERYYLQPYMPMQLAPGAKLCVLCQVQASLPKPWVDEASGIEEFLCGTCACIRERTEAKNVFKKLGDSWERADLPVAWVRIGLDYKQLSRTLGDLFGDYLKNSGLSSQELELLRTGLRDTALMVDFTRDYCELLQRFAKRLKLELVENSVEEIAGESPELLAVALRKKGDAFKIADILLEEFDQLFPLCQEHSPICISVSISNAKYPFFEHWTYLKVPAREISIQAVGRARLELSIARFKGLRGLNLEEERASSKLHRAAAIRARTGSGLMAQMEFLDDIRLYPALHQAHIQGFPVGDLLAYHKIAAIGG